MKRNGFTLIEILVVLAITALLSSLAIIYTHVGQNQVSLSVEESKVAQFILEAKELSIATYSTSKTTCAYGVQFNYASSTYSIFQYNTAVPTGPTGRPICPSIASTSAAGVVSGAISIYEQGSWHVHTADGVTLIKPTSTASYGIYDVLFYPPDPCTLVSLDGTTFVSDCAGGGAGPLDTGYVRLSTVDGSDSRTISVNSAGQVSL
jgi:prepilin-type N-terminal cleavage/methylation domain-containing protein